MPRRKKQQKIDKKDIDQTLEDLGIDADLSAEDSAADLEETDQRNLEKHEVPGIVAVPDAEPATSTVVEEVAAPAAPARAPVAVAPAPVAAAPVPVAEVAPPVLPDPDPLPAVVAPPSAPVRPRKGARSPSTGKLGTGLSGKMPGAERVKIYKRVDGQLGHISDYDARDLQGYPDMESFLNRHVKPSFGHGEYEMIGVDGHGREVPAGKVLLLGPQKETEGTQASGAFSLVQSVLEQNQNAQREWMNQMKSSMHQPPQKDPVEMLSGVMALQEKVSAKGEAATAAAAAKAEALAAASAAESAAAGQSTMQMFMAMMQQQQQAADRQSQMMMTLLSKPKEEDPMMKMFMMKLMEEKTSGGGGVAIPPPPPPADPLDSITKLITALAAAGVIGGGGGGGEDESKELLKVMLEKSDAERLGPKDMLALFGEMRGDRGTDDFKKSADNLAMMLNITNQLKQSTEGGAAAGFFDALAALFSNRDFAGSIAQSVRSRAEGTQSKQMEAQHQEQVIRQRALIQAEQERRAVARLAKQQGTTEEGQNGASKRPPPVSSVEDVVDSASENMAPPLPANTADHINNINEAKDEAALIESTLRLLIYMSGFDDWRPYTEQMFAAAQEGSAREVLQFLAQLLDVFVKQELMAVPLAQKVLVCVRDNMDLIHKELSNGNEGILDDPPQGEVDFLEELDAAEAELEGDRDDDDDDDDEGIAQDTEEDSPRA